MRAVIGVEGVPTAQSVRPVAHVDRIHVLLQSCLLFVEVMLFVRRALHGPLALLHCRQMFVDVIQTRGARVADMVAGVDAGRRLRRQPDPIVRRGRDGQRQQGRDE